MQPSANNGIVAFVCGELSIDGGQPLMFTEVFNLMPGGSQGYFILNNIFRLNLAGWKVNSVCWAQKINHKK